jgi:hypothetical protein
MSNRAVVAIATMFSVLVAWNSADAAQTQTTPAPSPSPRIEQLEWLVGGVWTADASKLPGGLTRIETRYDSVAGVVIRFTTMFFDKQNKVVNSYAGNLYLDPNVNNLSIWYIDSQNSITQGQITTDGDDFTISFRAPGDIVGEKQLVNFRCQITRHGSDDYTWSLSAQSPTKWAKIFNLEYVRS